MHVDSNVGSIRFVDTWLRVINIYLYLPLCETLSFQCGTRYMNTFEKLTREIESIIMKRGWTY